MFTPHIHVFKVDLAVNDQSMLNKTDCVYPALAIKLLQINIKKCEQSVNQAGIIPYRVFTVNNCLLLSSEHSGIDFNDNKNDFIIQIIDTHDFKHNVPMTDVEAVQGICVRLDRFGYL